MLISPCSAPESPPTVSCSLAVLTPSSDGHIHPFLSADLIPAPDSLEGCFNYLCLLLSISHALPKPNPNALHRPLLPHHHHLPDGCSWNSPFSNCFHKLQILSPYLQQGLLSCERGPGWKVTEEALEASWSPAWLGLNHTMPWTSVSKPVRWV